jgi:two-component system, OmpR family, sensor kinase
VTPLLTTTRPPLRLRLRLPRLARPRLARPRLRLRGLSLRLRLALASSTLLGVTLVGFCAIVYFTQARALMDEVDRALVDRGQVVASAITVSGSPFGPVIGLPDSEALAFSGTLVQIANAGGEIRSRSELLAQFGLELPVTAEAQAAVAAGRAHFERVVLAGVPLRLYTRPLILARVPIGLVQVARPIGPTEETLAVLRLVLAGGATGSVVISAVLGFLLAHTALRPIHRLTREAEQIGKSQDFGRRVTARGSDEVGRLGLTFNEMLAQLQAAYAALQSVNARLEAALESQRRFVADASHELRTPLTTVRGNASLLGRLEMLTPEDRRDAVAQISAEAERMSRLVGDLLTLARADAGQLLERAPVPLGQLLEDVARQARVLAAGKVAVSVIRLDDASVVGDPEALRRLLVILVDNAIKYTPEGGSVSLGLKVDTLPATHTSDASYGGARVARIAVVDTGIGIAPADLPHIFDRFYRADRARGTGGTGLGLAIGRWIAEAHGGGITVESQPGSGSIFTVTLPLEPRGQVTAGREVGTTPGADGVSRLPEARPAPPTGASSPAAAGATSRYT